jgi:hypothetical protein
MKYAEYTVLLDDMTYMDYRWYDDEGYTKWHALCFEDKKVWESKTTLIKGDHGDVGFGVV